MTTKNKIPLLVLGYAVLVALIFLPHAFSEFVLHSQPKPQEEIQYYINKYHGKNLEGGGYDFNGEVYHYNPIGEYTHVCYKDFKEGFRLYTCDLEEYRWQQLPSPLFMEFYNALWIFFAVSLLLYTGHFIWKKAK